MSIFWYKIFSGIFYQMVRPGTGLPRHHDAPELYLDRFSDPCIQANINAFPSGIQNDPDQLSGCARWRGVSPVCIQLGELAHYFSLHFRVIFYCQRNQFQLYRSGRRESTLLRCCWYSKRSPHFVGGDPF